MIVTIFSESLSSQSSQWCVIPSVRKGFGAFFFFFENTAVLLIFTEKNKRQFNYKGYNFTFCKNTHFNADCLPSRIVYDTVGFKNMLKTCQKDRVQGC